MSLCDLICPGSMARGWSKQTPERQGELEPVKDSDDFDISTSLPFLKSLGEEVI